MTPVRHASAVANPTESPPRAPLVEKSLSDRGVLTLTFNQPHKLNAWTMPLLKELFLALRDATPDPEVRGVVLTGTGKYYSAGVDLSAIIKPMAPATLIRQIRDQNQRLFAMVVEFPKVRPNMYPRVLIPAVRRRNLRDVPTVLPLDTFSTLQQLPASVLPPAMRLDHLRAYPYYPWTPPMGCRTRKT